MTASNISNHKARRGIRSFCLRYSKGSELNLLWTDKLCFEAEVISITDYFLQGFFLQTVVVIKTFCLTTESLCCKGCGANKVSILIRLREAIDE